MHTDGILVNTTVNALCGTGKHRIRHRCLGVADSQKSVEGEVECTAIRPPGFGL